MEQTMMVSRETQELLKENNALRQRVRMLEAQLEDERSRKDAYAHVAHKHFAERLRGYGRRVWHAELREDIRTAGKVAAETIGVAFVAWNVFMRIWGLRV